MPSVMQALLHTQQPQRCNNEDFPSGKALQPIQPQEMQLAQSLWLEGLLIVHSFPVQPHSSWAALIQGLSRPGVTGPAVTAQQGI